MSDSTPLGSFLRARREALKPRDAGLPEHGRRRVPGLRREEVAILAGVSPDYYMRLEQGRESSPSPQVVESVAAALQLVDEESDHLRRLTRLPHMRRVRSADRLGRGGQGSGHEGNRRHEGNRHHEDGDEGGDGERKGGGADAVSPQLLQLLGSWPETPAFVLGLALDVLAHNALAAALHSGFQRFDNLARMVFLDPAGRGFYQEWEKTARACAAELRLAYGHVPDAPRLTQVVNTLSAKSREFAELWARHDVRAKTQQSKGLIHPDVGALEIQSSAFTVNDAPRQQLLVYQADPAGPAATALAKLRLLADRVTGGSAGPSGGDPTGPGAGNHSGATLNGA